MEQQLTRQFPDLGGPHWYSWLVVLTLSLHQWWMKPKNWDQVYSTPESTIFVGAKNLGIKSIMSHGSDSKPPFCERKMFWKSFPIPSKKTKKNPVNGYWIPSVLGNPPSNVVRKKKKATPKWDIQKLMSKKNEGNFPPVFWPSIWRVLGHQKLPGFQWMDLSILSQRKVKTFRCLTCHYILVGLKGPL